MSGRHYNLPIVSLDVAKICEENPAARVRSCLAWPGLAWLAFGCITFEQNQRNRSSCLSWSNRAVVAELCENLGTSTLPRIVSLGSSKTL